MFVSLLNSIEKACKRFVVNEFSECNKQLIDFPIVLVFWWCRLHSDCQFLQDAHLLSTSPTPKFAHHVIQKCFINGPTRRGNGWITTWRIFQRWWWFCRCWNSQAFFYSRPHPSYHHEISRSHFQQQRDVSWVQPKIFHWCLWSGMWGYPLMKASSW